MHLVTDHIHPPQSSKQRIPLKIDRHDLAKRRFRAQAEDGADFGFDLSHPLAHGDAIHETDTAVYVVDQLHEPVLKIPFHDATTGARYGWMIGNMHFPAAFEPGAIIAEADPAVRQMLERAEIPYEESEAIFEPAATAPGHHHH